LAALLQLILGLVNQLYFLRITPCPKEYFRFTGKMEGYLARGVALSRPIAAKIRPCRRSYSLNATRTIQ
jgi:hypothetical protein